MPSQIICGVSVVLGLSLMVMVWVFKSGWHKGPATALWSDVVNCTVYTPALVNVISGSKEEAFPEVKLQPGLVTFGQFKGFVGVTCHA